MVNVLIVDDSRFFRKTIRTFLESDKKINVIAEADNGQEAIDMVERYHPDVITMDIEMPKMDGVTAVKKIMATRPTPILMFSNLTEKGAAITLEALHAGAADFLPKNFQNSEHSSKEQLAEKLLTRIKVLALKSKSTNVSEQISEKLQSKSIQKETNSLVRVLNYDLIAIGASTGGPAALEKVLTQLPASFPSPIVIIQHMPELFTKAFAKRLDMLCRLNVVEITDGLQLKPGCAYIAPGGKQTYLKREDGQTIFNIKEADKNIIYKPCVDETFKSIAQVYKSKKVLAIVMTGMGNDGCDGIKHLKQNGVDVWIQNKSTSVVYGMPMAIANENLADKVLAIDDIGVHLAKTA